MKKLIALSLSLAIFSTQAFANSNIDVRANKTKETTKSKAIDKSKSKTISREKAEEQGQGISQRQEQGFRESERREIAKALEKLRHTGITVEVSIPTLVFMNLTNMYPNLLQRTVNDFYTVPLIQHGFVNVTRIEYFNNIAKAQQSTPYLNTQAVIDYMKTLMSITHQIKDEVKILNNEVLGLEDYEEIAKDIAKKIDVSKRKAFFPISNRCILVNDYQHFRCGSCTLDVSNVSGIPILSCSGIQVFSPNSILGYTIKATANTSYSFKEVESEIKSTEIYKAISRAVETYARKMERRGVSVNKTMLKKLLMETAIKDSKTFDLALTKMQKEEEPTELFRFLR